MRRPLVRGSRHPAGADTVMMTMVRRRIKRMATMVRRVIRMIWWVKAMMAKTMVRIKRMITMGVSIEMMRRNPRFENGIPGFA